MRLVALLLTAVVVSGCDASHDADDRPVVVAGFYPLAWAAERIGGADVRVVNLTPAGTEPHDLELSPRQAGSVRGASLVVYVGGAFQPALEDAVAALGVPYRTQFPCFLYGLRYFLDFYLPTLGVVIEVDDPSHNRLDKSEAAVFHEEADRRAVRPAAEAMVELLGLAHRERRRFFAVKRAEAKVIGAALFKLYKFSHYIQDVDAGQDLLYRIRRNHAIRGTTNLG